MKKRKDDLSIFELDRIIFKKLPHVRFDQVSVLEMNKTFKSSMKDFKPSTILTYFENDTNIENHGVAESIFTTSRTGASNTVSNVVTAGIPTSTERNFNQLFFK
jgi:hypothetical protein